MQTEGNGDKKSNIRALSSLNRVTGKNGDWFMDVLCILKTLNLFIFYKLLLYMLRTQFLKQNRENLEYLEIEQRLNNSFENSHKIQPSTRI